MQPLDKLSALWKLRALARHPFKFMQVMRDEKTPITARFIVIAAVIYIFFPFDLAPDFIPFIGQVDDIAIAVYLVSFAIRLIPDEVFSRAGLVASIDENT